MERDKRKLKKMKLMYYGDVTKVATSLGLSRPCVRRALNGVASYENNELVRNEVKKNYRFAFVK